MRTDMAHAALEMLADDHDLVQYLVRGQLGQAPNVRQRQRTCHKPSPARPQVTWRAKPALPVAQNAQAMAQPTCRPPLLKVKLIAQCRGGRQPHLRGHADSEALVLLVWDGHLQPAAESGQSTPALAHNSMAVREALSLTSGKAAHSQQWCSCARPLAASG